MYVIVLARTPQEGSTYAKRAKLPRGRYRVATSASTIRGLRVAEVHELPSFAQRPDRHAVEAELRFARGPRKQVEMPERDDRVDEEAALAIVEAELEGLAEALHERLDGQSDRLARAFVEDYFERYADVTTWHRDALVEVVGNVDPALLPEEDDGEETGTPEPSKAPAPAPKPKRPAKKAAAKPPVNTPDFF